MPLEGWHCPSFFDSAQSHLLACDNLHNSRIRGGTVRVVPHQTAARLNSPHLRVCAQHPIYYLILIFL